jgi:hypothetical protein
MKLLEELRRIKSVPRPKSSVSVFRRTAPSGKTTLVASFRGDAANAVFRAWLSTK